MSQRRLVLRALQDAGVTESQDRRVQEFVGLLRERPELCWPDLVTEFRDRYYDLFEELIPALEKSDDPFIRTMLIRFADPKRPRERQMLTDLASTTDAERDAVSARQLGELGIKDVDRALQARRKEAEARGESEGRAAAGTGSEGKAGGRSESAPGAEQPVPPRKRGIR